MILGLDHDTIPRSHRFSQDDYEYLKHLELQDYELYDLSQDFSQENNLFDTHPKRDSFKTLLDNQLTEIKSNLYPWKDLPLNLEKRKKKKETGPKKTRRRKKQKTARAYASLRSVP